MSLIVRRARVEDARTIAEYALKLFAQHREYDPDRFARLGNLEGAAWFYGSQTEADDVAVLVAEIDNKVVGYAYLQYEARNYTDLLESAVRLHDIYVDGSRRGTGTGTKLIEAVVEMAKEFGADKVVLSTAAGNEFARDFFAQRGFRTTMVEMTLNLGEPGLRGQ